MPELKTLDFNDIARQVMDPATYDAANRPRTVSTGNYRVYRQDVKAQENDQGQQFLHYTVLLKDKDGNGRGTQFFDAAWNTYKDEGGKPLKSTRLFGQLAKALGIAKDEASPALVDAAFTDIPVSGYFTETLRSPVAPGERSRYQQVRYTEDGGYDADSKLLMAEGWTAQNYLQSISAIKAEA